jgi:transglutaminase-like putative cysteine protease
MIEAAQRRAEAAEDEEGLAAIAVIERLATRAGGNTGAQALGAIAQKARSFALRAEARFAEARVGAAPSGDSFGLVRNLALLGPLRDTGGGLLRAEGPEDKGYDPAAQFSWGTVLVQWRSLPPLFAGLRGVPLDVFVAPRKESCTYLATAVRADGPQKAVLRVASSGQVKLLLDGVEIARSEEVHRFAHFDRIAAKVSLDAGPHTVAIKTCSGALGDEGRVRVRITDDAGAALDLHADGSIAALAAASRDKASKVAKGPSRKAAPRDKTPLEAALAAGKLPSAVLRTLGGADDLRSPRAAGTLQGILGSKDQAPDLLAFAAWISPAAATRTGWLHVAQQRASGDPKTLAFVRAELAGELVSSQLPDEALSLLQGKPAGEGSYAAVTTARALEGLGIEAMRRLAYQRLRAVYLESKAKVSVELLSHLLRLAPAYDTAIARAAASDLATRGYPTREYVQLASTEGSTALTQAALVLFAGNLDDADEGTAVVETVLGAGAAKDGLTLAQMLFAFAPNRAPTFALLARASSDNGAKASEIAGYLARARDLEPTDARFRSELLLRKGTQGPAPGTDEKYIVAPGVFLARRKGVPAGLSDVADRELHWFRAVRTHADGRVSQLIHYAKEIVIAPKSQSELYEDIPAEGELTELLRARVHRKAGGVALPLEVHDDGARPRVRWPNLEPGDTVEIALRTWTSSAVGGRGDAPYHFMDYAGAPATHPLIYNEVVIETVPERPLYVDVLRGTDHKRTESTDEGRKVVRYVWDAPVSVPEEPLSPPLSEIVPVIVGSTFKNWEDFRTWYRGAIQGFTEPDDEVRALAKQLTKGKVSREDKLRALFDFVADDIRYVNYVSGEWWLPNRPQQLLSRREGDCDDKALLLITLLKSIGIEAQEVMVQTRLTNMPSLLRSKNVAVPLFDHGIAFLPGPGGGRYLDATSPKSRLGPLPSMDAHGLALRMDGPAEIVELPASSPESHGADVNWTVRIGQDGGADIVGEELHSGDGAFYLRTYLSEEAGRAQFVEDGLVGPWMAEVEVDKTIDFAADLPDGKSRVKYKAHSGQLARPDGQDLAVPIAPATSLASQLAALPVRKTPVQLPPSLAPSHHSRVLRFVAPPGHRWLDAPPGGDLRSEFGRAQLSLAPDPADPRTLVVRRNLTLSKPLISTQEYAAFRAFVLQVDALMNKTLRLGRTER